MDVTGNINTEDPSDTNKEVRRIYESLFGSTLFDKVEYVVEDVTKLFDGVYSGYQKCDTEYHNLEHTLQAYLAMARIFSGLIRENPTVTSKEVVVLGLIAALGHDTGFIKETWDTEGRGGKYSWIHVDRSKEFMGKYLPQLEFNLLQVEYVKNIISCTGVRIDPLHIQFTSEKEREAGHILGTADLLGQMSDPNYIENLLKLYEEFKDGGILEYTSAQDLIKKTPAFWEGFAMKRLKEDFNSVYRFAANHSEGNNYYIDGINRNIALIPQWLSCYS